MPQALYIYSNRYFISRRRHPIWPYIYTHFCTGTGRGPIFNTKTHLSFARMQFLTANARDGIEFCQTAAELRRHPLGSIFTRTSVQAPAEGQFSTEKQVYSSPGCHFLTASAQDGIEIGQRSAEWRRRHPLWLHIYMHF